MYQIEANISKSKYIEVSDEHLETIRKYSLLKDLIDSNGIVDESVVEKLHQAQAKTNNCSTCAWMLCIINI